MKNIDAVQSLLKLSLTFSPVYLGRVGATSRLWRPDSSRNFLFSGRGRRHHILLLNHHLLIHIVLGHLLLLNHHRRFLPAFPRGDFEQEIRSTSHFGEEGRNQNSSHRSQSHDLHLRRCQVSQRLQMELIDQKKKEYMKCATKSQVS